jgi:hypothetical protein
MSVASGVTPRTSYSVVSLTFLLIVQVQKWVVSSSEGSGGMTESRYFSSALGRTCKDLGQDECDPAKSWCSRIAGSCADCRVTGRLCVRRRRGRRAEANSEWRNEIQSRDMTIAINPYGPYLTVCALRSTRPNKQKGRSNHIQPHTKATSHPALDHLTHLPRPRDGRLARSRSVQAQEGSGPRRPDRQSAAQERRCSGTLPVRESYSYHRPVSRHGQLGERYSASAHARRVQSRREVDEFSRGARGTPRSSERVLFDPSRPLAPAPPPSYESTRPSSSRGDVPSPLPSAHAHHAASASAPASTHDERHRRRAAVPGRETPPGGSRRLFDPSIHDPHHFAPKQTTPSLASTSASASASHHSGLGPSRSGLRRPPTVGRTAEEEADRERERRKRREGSERGGQSSGSGPKKRESDGRSRGSRSSEGSESFKDRERGKGKG